jgi:hypothetical protein
MALDRAFGVGARASAGRAAERGHKALQQQTVRDPKYNNSNKNNNNKKKNYLYLAATRFMTSLSCCCRMFVAVAAAGGLLLLLLLLLLPLLLLVDYRMFAVFVGIRAVVANLEAQPEVKSASNNSQLLTVFANGCQLVVQQPWQPRKQRGEACRACRQHPSICLA